MTIAQIRKPYWIISIIGIFMIGFFAGKTESVSNVSLFSTKNASKNNHQTLATQEPLDELTRQINISKQADFDQGVYSPSTKLTIHPFDKGWIISDRLADLLALSSTERQSAQDAINRSRQNFEDLARSNIEYLPSEPGLLAVRIRPYMREGHSQLETLRSELNKALPKDVAEELFCYFRWRPLFGSFGANEVEIEFGENEKTGDLKSIKFTRRHGMTGQNLSNYACDAETLESMEGFTRALF